MATAADTEGYAITVPSGGQTEIIIFSSMISIGYTVYKKVSKRFF